ncbi:hypothetical protein CAPTEDRAFT_221047 [Capitella teleta]|uniref:Uncharacterized protein n=1 Tax=Capitella teleta TaxID=283909 RepID=R7UEV1_CAPTE|nr:hypothetical protein CAPTEDRAFT_221047 [Capitella teleta]|eukprot:ELU04494.1 hypothetical protein CAPTEDRAFT_221047 [Capitella teleta]
MLAQHWSGPISASVYVSNIQDSSMIDNLCQFSTASNIFIHVLHAVGDIYPANILRNFALEEVFTEYVFLSDVDFMPDFSLYNASVDFIQHNERHLNSSAFVVAAFEILNDSKTWGQPVQFPRNKTELIDLWGAQKLQPFHFSKTKNYGHIETNYEKWTVAHEIYAVTWMPYYEPYVIVRTSTVPRYHNAFVGRYFDKTSHLMELYYAGPTDIQRETGTKLNPKSFRRGAFHHTQYMVRILGFTGFFCGPFATCSSKIGDWTLQSREKIVSKAEQAKAFEFIDRNISVDYLLISDLSLCRKGKTI